MKLNQPVLYRFGPSWKEIFNRLKVIIPDININWSCIIQMVKKPVLIVEKSKGSSDESADILHQYPGNVYGNLNNGKSMSLIGYQQVKRT